MSAGSPDTVDEALTKAGVKPGEIERVFLTGGTSFVPAIRHLFVERFGESRLTSADQFESIAYGLGADRPDGGSGALGRHELGEFKIKLRLPRW